MPDKLLVENPLAGTLCFTNFQSVINWEQHENISTINPAIMENTECLIVKSRTPIIAIKVGVWFNTVYHYASFRFLLFNRLANTSKKQ